MRPGKLYIKIFLSFLMVLVVTEILVFGLFMAAAGREVYSRFEQYTVAKVLLLKEVVENKISARSQQPVSENRSLEEFLIRFDGTLGAYIWVAKPDGTPLLKSFEGALPDKRLKEFEGSRVKDFGDFKVFSSRKRHWGFYGLIPLTPGDGEPLKLHVLFKKREPPPHSEGGFALGLVIIGLVIAVLIIPISRFITNPIRELRESALRIAEGDLSHRAEVKKKNEIGELGRAFNHMAGRLEKMIRGGRELTANVSHELRSPLARMRVAAELLSDKLEKGDNKGCRVHMEEILEDIEEVDRLIGRILDLSKLDIHGKAIRMEEMDLSGLLREHLEKQESIIEQKKLIIAADLPETQIFAGDRETLTMAFSNIIDNAFKFVPEKGSVRMEMFREGDTLCIQVANTFEAIPEDELQEIFEPFHRAAPGVPGSGLGLAITKRVIRGHGGTIGAANSKDGFSIRVRLPLSPSGPAAS
jgi:signal transduction histidine kinase